MVSKQLKNIETKDWKKLLQFRVYLEFCLSHFNRYDNYRRNNDLSELYSINRLTCEKRNVYFIITSQANQFVLQLMYARTNIFIRNMFAFN